MIHQFSQFISFEGKINSYINAHQAIFISPVLVPTYLSSIISRFHYNVNSVVHSSVY